jgi:hypothetical protein
VAELDERFKKKCPRKLEGIPDTWCPLAVLRLKSIKALGREPTAEEESKMPGCPWAISHQLSGYCWFKYEANHMEEQPQSDHNIAALLVLSPETIKTTANNALSKLQKEMKVNSIKEIFEGESVIDDYNKEDDSIYCE